MLRRFYILAVLLPIISFSCGCNNTEQKEEEENDMYDGPGIAVKYEHDRTKDPATGMVPREKLWAAIEYTEQLKQDMRSRMAASKTTITGWVERGPTSDAVGPSNNNGRGGNSSTAGRVRALLVDANDATGNTVWVGGVAGGMWKTTSINGTPAWTLVDDKFGNLAITGICQDPVTPTTMYFCTGESFYNSDGIRGNGIFKTINGGASWIQLPSTVGADFYFCTKIVCDAAGNVYVGTSNSFSANGYSGVGGLRRSINGGVSWTDITPSGFTSDNISDIEISSTGRMHVSSGIFSTCQYRYTDAPAIATAASGWVAATSGYPPSDKRIELACEGSTLIALPSNNSYAVPTIYRSTDGGDTWSALANSASGFVNGAAWYCLAADINPSNTSEFIVGSLDCYKTTNAGATAWTKISNWVNASPYVHADQHQVFWYNASAQNRVLIACDGGIFLSTDGGSTFADKNIGLRIKQFYSCAIHPAAGSSYLLGGTQDNGCHSFSNAGLSNSVETTGGDGGFVHIDQDQPLIQFGSYINNQYRRSTDGGNTWVSVNLSTSGRFINPIDYDDVNNIMYCADAAGRYRRWTNPTSGSTSATVTITALNSADVTAVALSPYTAHRLYLGTEDGRVVRVEGANTIASGSAGVNVSGAFPAGGTVSSISFGTTEDTMMVVFCNYGVTNIWYTTNGTSATPTWVAKDGALPDMPIRWGTFMPGRSKLVTIATETGVWFCNDINAAVPLWFPDPTFPNVSTHMLKIRASDKAMVAATHGRGMWTSDAYEAFQIALPLTEFTLTGKRSGQGVKLNWAYNTSRTSMKFDVEQSSNGKEYRHVATVSGSPGRQTYNYEAARNEGIVYYRIKAYDAYGLTEYCNSISFYDNKYLANSITNLYPNPAKEELFISFNSISDTKVQFNVYGLNGSKVYSGPMQSVTKGNQVMNINVRQLAHGQYLLEAVIDDQKLRKQFLKH